MNIVVTGAEGFIGRNLCTHLSQSDDFDVAEMGREHTLLELQEAISQADIVFHLAGINRPKDEQEFRTGNIDFTQQLCQLMHETGRSIPIIFSSSTQVERDNPYGKSKLAAENVIARYAEENEAAAHIFRLTNVFGKWCRPNYNSVVATFCHNIAHDLPITVSNREHELTFICVDDVVDSFLAISKDHDSGVFFHNAGPTYQTTLGELADLIKAFRTSRTSLIAPDFSNPFVYKLYATYLTYLEEDAFGYDLVQRCDPRGCLAEFVKAPALGQIFVSRTVSGITRGNHYHHLKTEKFLVLEGDAIIRFRHLQSDKVLEYPVKGSDFRVVDIPPGYTHSIENVGVGELVTLFWASEIFDPSRPDTIYLNV